jgi:L-serine deaminase
MEKKYDSQFKVVFDAIRQLMESPVKGKKQIGFRVGKEYGRLQILASHV